MSHKLDKETLDKVRGIDGFPIGDDEDVNTLSIHPNYTACPNPWLEDFVKENGSSYDSNNDDYQKRPFAHDVSEGKGDSIYYAHSYHTKIPHKAIIPYLMHFTEPGDLIYDGFCGTGMTGIASQMCEFQNNNLTDDMGKKYADSKWGKRSTILCDLSPCATFIAYNYNNSSDSKVFFDFSQKILKEIRTETEWMYKTSHSIKNEIQYEFDLNNQKKPIKGIINYVVWSEVFTCPNCLEELIYWNIALNEKKEFKKEFNCTACNTKLTKNKLLKATKTVADNESQKILKQVKIIPVLINYTIKKNGKNIRFDKSPDEYDFQLIKQIDDKKFDVFFPKQKMMFKGEKWGDTWRKGVHLGMKNTSDFYTSRNLHVLSQIFKKISAIENTVLRNSILFAFTGMLGRASKMYRWNPSRPTGTLSGTLYIGSLHYEFQLIDMFSRRINAAYKSLQDISKFQNSNIITTQSSTNMPQIPDNTIDYIFTDPPFGDNLMYSELNYLSESWLKLFSNNKNESIISTSQKKGLVEYQQLMEQCFKENYRILKPGRWMTVVFHNSKNKVWVAIQEALSKAGFIVADVRTLDKKQSSFKQIVSTTAVKQDLVISSYKPSGGLDEFFGGLTTGTEEGVWKFLDVHLKQLPVFVEKNDKVEIITERQKFLLFDRMVAFYIQKGLHVPISASEFYEKLNQKYVERDGMHFLSEQIPEYDQKRVQVKSVEQSTIFVEDEKSTILWLNEQLKTPQTYQDIQPKFLQEIHQNKFEKLPELSEILEQNFLEEDGKWHIPDPTKLKDLEKLREKSLLREFQTYVESKGKLKQFRLEAIRAGFKKKWSENDYKSIVDIAQRLPEQIIQEDSSLLMYYDNALSRLR